MPVTPAFADTNPAIGEQLDLDERVGLYAPIDIGASDS
jgi:hypothetical protein